MQAVEKLFRSGPRAFRTLEHARDKKQRLPKISSPWSLAKISSQRLWRAICHLQVPSTGGSLAFMGLFSKDKKENPRISFHGVEFTFFEEAAWRFSFGGVDFWFHGRAFHCPTLGELEQITGTLAALEPEMTGRARKGVEEWGEGATLENIERSADLSEWPTDGTVWVTWSDGDGWGDMAVDFEVKDGAIISEGWGD